MRNSKTKMCIASIIILGLSILSVTSLTHADLSSFNNVQINIQTSNIQSGYFTVSAYNMTGYLESSVQTHYSAASFELPNGQYIFTVTANNQTNSIYPIPLASGATSSSGESSTPALPIPIAPAIEYGYAVQQISSPTSITITTQNVSSFPTNTLTIQVLYANGTAAANASVSASTIGSSYYWGYEPNVVTWASTGPNGIATLVTPVAPEQINAWSWLPLNLTNSPPPQVIVGGEPVNTSGPVMPTYIGLAGSTLIIPPQTTATITLYAQQQNYWVTPYAATSSSSSSAGPGAIPESVYATQQGDPALRTTTTPTPTGKGSPTTMGNTLLLTILLAAVVAVAVAASLIIATRTKRKQQPSLQTNQTQ